MSYSLIIIDMQPHFSASNDFNVIDACKAEIKKAIDARASIIFVEYMGAGATNPSLVSLTDLYKKTFLVRKDDDSGATEVTRVIKQNNLAHKNIVVCGVNTDACVLETVAGLTIRFKKSKFKIISEACNSEDDHEHGLLQLSEFPKCKII